MARNNNKGGKPQTNNRTAAFQGNPGSNQSRQTLPLSRSQAAQVNKQYYMDGPNMSPMANTYQNLGKSAVSPMVTAWTAAKTIKAYHDSLPPNMQITREKVANAINAFSQPQKGGSATAMNSSYGLSKAPTPKVVNLNSGIVPNTYVNDSMNSKLNECSPMHMNCNVLNIPVATTNPLNTYFTGTICFDIQTRAQANVNFALDIANAFSATKILTAMNAAINALQIYYYYASILSYESDTRNKNEAMTYLRQGITPQYISDLVQLGHRLEDTPIPPRVVEWVRYMSMNYLSGNSQGAPIIKLGFDPTVMDTNYSTSPIATALAALVTPDSVNVFTLLRRTVPKWRVKKLYDVPSTPTFDKNFLTIFANLPSQIWNGSINIYTHTVSLNTDTVVYNSFNNKLDGVAFAMSSVKIGTDWIPGLAVPTQVQTALSKRSFYQSTANALPGWRSTVLDPFLVRCRLESYQGDGNPSFTTPHLYGADKCLGVSASALTQTAKNTLDYLFDVESIPAKGNLSHFSRTGS